MKGIEAAVIAIRVIECSFIRVKLPMIRLCGETIAWHWILRLRIMP
jgi:hypothetical protein